MKKSRSCAWGFSSHPGVVFLKASPPKSPLSLRLSSEFIRPCLASVLPVSFCGGRGSTDLRPDFPKSAWQTGKRKWGHGGTLERCFSFVAVLKGNPGYYSSPVLLIMHAEGFHCLSRPTNCGIGSCHRLLDAAWKKDPIFMFIHGRVLTQMTLLAAELPCMKRPVLLPVLYVEIVVYLHCISQLGLQKTIQPLIYFLFPGNHLEYLFIFNSFIFFSTHTWRESPISNLFKHNGKSSNGRGQDSLLGTVIWINTGS